MKIRVNKLDGLRPIHQESSEITKKYMQVKSFLVDNLHILYSQPEYLSEKNVEWRTELTGDILCYIDADEQTQELIRIQLKNQVDSIYENFKDKNQDMVDYLKLILEIPSLENIFFIDNQVVIINWGYIEDSYNAERGIIQKLISGSLLTINIEDDEGVMVADLPMTITYGNNNIKSITDLNGQVNMDVIYGSSVEISIDLKADKTYQNNTVEKNVKCLEENTELLIILELAEIPVTTSWYIQHKKKIYTGLLLLLVLCAALLFMYLNNDEVEKGNYIDPNGEKLIVRTTGENKVFNNREILDDGSKGSINTRAQYGYDLNTPKPIKTICLVEYDGDYDNTNYIEVTLVKLDGSIIKLPHLIPSGDDVEKTHVVSISPPYNSFVIQRVILAPRQQDGSLDKLGGVWDVRKLWVE